MSATITAIGNGKEKAMLTPTELLPCPFCGGDVIMQTAAKRSGLNPCVKRPVCKQCNVTVFVWKSQDDAAAAWNHRTPPIVYCKDCARRLNAKGKESCDIYKNFGSDDFFCKHGKKKEGNT